MNSFRGIRKVYAIEVAEGKGVEGDPSRIVRYIFDLDQHGGSFGGFVGKIDPFENPNQEAEANKTHE